MTPAESFVTRDSSQQVADLLLPQRGGILWILEREDGAPVAAILPVGGQAEEAMFRQFSWLSAKTVAEAVVDMRHAADTLEWMATGKLPSGTLTRNMISALQAEVGDLTEYGQLAQLVADVGAVATGLDHARGESRPQMIADLLVTVAARAARWAQALLDGEIDGDGDD